MEPIHVLIADDHPFFRDGLRVLLEATADTECVGEATTGDEVITLAERMQPDVILMDLQMPGQNGIEATRRIVQTSPHIAVLVVTMYEDDASVFAAMQAGARGYLLKAPIGRRCCSLSGLLAAGRRSSVRRSPGD